MTEEGTKKFEEATRNAYEKGETAGYRIMMDPDL